MSENKKSFKETKEAQLKLENQLQSTQQIVNSKFNKGVKPKKQKPEQKKTRNLDPLVLKLIKESYNLKLEQMGKMQESLLAAFQQHPITLEYQRREAVEASFLKLQASYESSKNQLNEFYLQSRKEYLEWLKMLEKEEKDV